MAKAPKKKPVRTEVADLLVVGIGASAGGLEALQEFFKAVPLDTGLAFVVIQHLSPDYKSLMDELLARQTKLKILVIEDSMPLEPNTIFLIPPRKDLSIFHDKLILQEQSLKRGLHLPVDVFFASLAAEKGKNAIGIILSGTGSDGTLGTRAIKEAGGMVMVQDEKTAKFDGMPRSSISTGLVDYILPPNQMPEALVTYVHHPFVQKGTSLENTLAQNFDPLSKIMLLLRDHSGIDFSYYKENTVIRRLERRVSINRFDTLDEYLVYLADSDKEKSSLFREMLIGVTRFFRDTEAFDALQKKVFPLLAHKRHLRIWSAGCSTGEEVYSLAILVLSYLEQNKLTCEVTIFATDVDRHSLEVAGRGFYADSVVADVDPALMNRYFHKQEDGYQVTEAVRRMIVFASHNVLKDPPFSKLDLLVCRNLFIYFKPELQTRLLSSFYHSLSPEGFLFMGSSESLGEVSEGFEPLDSKWKIYRYRPGFQVSLAKTLPLTVSVDETESRLTGARQKELARWDHMMSQVLSLYLPPSVVVDAQDQVLQTINDMSRFLKIPSGRFSQNLYDLLPHELGLLVSSLLRKIKKSGESFLLENLVGIKGFEGELLSLQGHVLSSDRSTYYLLCFRTNAATAAVATDVSPPQEVNQLYAGRVGDLERELQFTRESLQATVEELETSNEELQSSNEELIASNEELQSTNEELQSVNEELYTVNTEFQNKIEELTTLNNDEVNLLRNTEIGALYLDHRLCIRKLTPRVTEITRIVAADEGRPLDHLSALPGYPQLIEDIHAVSDTLRPLDREIVGVDKKTYLASIRPFRTGFNSIEGILVTFVEITKLKQAQELASQARHRLEDALRMGQMAWWEWDYQTGEVRYDPLKATMIGYTVDEFPHHVDDVCALIHPEDYDKTMEAMTDHLRGKTDLWEVSYRIRRKDGDYAVYYDRGTISERDAAGKPLRLVGTVIRMREGLYRG
ncbi:MAG: chemotaxis protein CheB [Spirochaetales bacterium]